MMICNNCKKDRPPYVHVGFKEMELMKPWCLVCAYAEGLREHEKIRRQILKEKYGLTEYPDGSLRGTRLELD